MTIDELLARVGRVEQATLAKSLPSGAEHYRFEIKYDGFRIVALKSGGEVRLYTRNGKDWTDAFPAVAAAVSALTPRELSLDGEVCGLDEHGRSSFLAMKSGSSIAYVVFDVLWVDGEDLRARSLEARRDVVDGLLHGAPAPLMTANIVEVNDVAAAMERARELGLEGLIAKLARLAVYAGPFARLAQAEMHDAPGVRARRLRAPGSHQRSSRCAAARDP